MSRLSTGEHADTVYGPPMEPPESNRLLIEACLTHGTWGDLQDAALYATQAEHQTGIGDQRDVDASGVLWWDRSLWEMPLRSNFLDKELVVARPADRQVADASLVCSLEKRESLHERVFLRGRLGGDVLKMSSGAGSMGHAGEALEGVSWRLFNRTVMTTRSRCARHLEPFPPPEPRSLLLSSPPRIFPRPLY